MVSESIIANHSCTSLVCGGKKLWLVSLLLLITHAHPLFVGKKLWLVSLLLLITHAHPLFMGKKLWLVSLLLLITHAHPLFVGKKIVVSESIIANHSCTSLVHG